MKIHEYNEMMRYLTRRGPSNNTQVARAPATIPFMAPELQEDISPMPNIPDLLREEGIQVGEQVAEGGRVGLKPGGLVEPGVTHYGRKKPPVPPTGLYDVVGRTKPIPPWMNAVAEKIIELSSVGVNHLIMSIEWPGMPQSLVLDTMLLLAKEVFPLVSKNI